MFICRYCWKAWYKSKLKTKVVFIILIKSPTTVIKIITLEYFEIELIALDCDWYIHDVIITCTTLQCTVVQLYSVQLYNFTVYSWTTLQCTVVQLYSVQLNNFTVYSWTTLQCTVVLLYSVQLNNFTVYSCTTLQCTVRQFYSVQAVLRYCSSHYGSIFTIFYIF